MFCLVEGNCIVCSIVKIGFSPLCKEERNLFFTYRSLAQPEAKQANPLFTPCVPSSSRQVTTSKAFWDVLRRAGTDTKDTLTVRAGETESVYWRMRQPLSQ